MHGFQHRLRACPPADEQKLWAATGLHGRDIIHDELFFTCFSRSAEDEIARRLRRKANGGAIGHLDI